MQYVLILHLLITIALVGMVLIQRSEGGGLGIGGGGGGGGFMTTRGSANAMTRITAYLAVAFFITSIGLSFLAGSQRGGAGATGGIGSVTDSLPVESTDPLGLPADGTIPQPADDAPEPAVPAEDDGLPEVPVGD